MTPKVSICVPSLNTRPFLPERFETLFQQSFHDWELLAYDSYSEDGSWEYLCELAAREPRLQVWQGPREGIYAAWNECVRRARGEYVYIATSDDTMAPDCLGKLVAALETHPDCDLAHCPLQILGESGPDLRDWWAQSSVFARSSGDLLGRKHVRRAPFDGLLHLSGESVYISVTQLLIRRSLLDRVGSFESRWGSVGDFNWNMRASLVANTIHVPDTWGGWRVHPGQATQTSTLETDQHRHKIEEMIDHAIASTEQLLTNPIRQQLRSGWCPYARDMRRLLLEVQSRRNPLRRKAFVLGRLLAGSWAAREYLKGRARGQPPWPKSAPEIIQNWLQKAGLGPVMAPA